MCKDEVKEIKFNTKYVTGEALRELITFNRNKYVIKGSTGVGGTTAILNSTQGNRLIISPNVGMIAGKEAQRNSYTSHKQAFIYSNSADDWQQVERYLHNSSEQNIIINTTPEQILHLKKTNHKLYDLIINIPIFIDEIHSYSVDNEYREAVGSFMELVYNEWLKPFILSTATPVSKFIDIPRGIDIDYLKISRADEQRKQLHYSTNKEDIKKFVESERSKGNMVVLFTNDKRYHVSNKDKKVKNLVGNNLNIKIAPYKRGNNLNDSDLFDCDLLICSSAYFAGFDIPTNCSICVISDQSNNAYKVCINNVIQAYGRCRKEVKNALFVNLTSKINNDFPTSTKELNDYFISYLNDVAHYNSITENKQYYYQVEQYAPFISKEMYVNRGALVANVVNKLHDYQLYNDEVLKAIFNEYGFDIISYVDSNNTNVTSDKYTFQERLNNLFLLDNDRLIKHYYSIKNNFKSKEKGAFSPSIAIEYLATFLIKECDIEVLYKKLNNKRARRDEVYKLLDNYLRINSDTQHLNEQLTTSQVNKLTPIYGGCKIDSKLQSLIDDWHFLYAIYKIKSKIYTKETARALNKQELFHDLEVYNNIYKDKKNRYRKARRTIINNCKKIGIELNENELFKLDECINTAFKELDTTGKYKNYNTRRNNTEKIVEVLGYLLTGGGKNYVVKEKKDREYNPITQLPSTFRHVIPIKMVEVDITSANPQIVDRVLGTHIGLNIYNNLMTTKNITRNEAKMTYNSFLNNHKSSIKRAYSFYLECGYTPEKANELSKLTAQVRKGSFYEKMTESEATIIFTYEQFLNDYKIKSYRFHDAIIIKETDAKKIHLPTQMKGYTFHLGYFNNENKYINTMKNEVKETIIRTLTNTTADVNKEDNNSILIDLCTELETWQPSKPTQIISFGDYNQVAKLQQQYGDLVVVGW
ncbi:DEAD/DEAH box helicase family protein [uncultured Tenacibaculum sp.]|uniref:DEAD/DEAH box helicase family protein n=1 Tax=uncultured Tenacibaculum sp. TaxID=174713 RepID=UPI0026388CE3|nr:DEAD/DEAH box helicase family protein [uncultured Tenacibaculum sp.]